jgi:hypothetical protein
MGKYKIGFNNNNVISIKSLDLKFMQFHHKIVVELTIKPHEH